MRTAAPTRIQVVAPSLRIPVVPGEVELWVTVTVVEALTVFPFHDAVIVTRAVPGWEPEANVEFFPMLAETVPRESFRLQE